MSNESSGPSKTVIEESKAPKVNSSDIRVEEPQEDIPGVSPKAAKIIYRSLKEKGKRYFGSSGASLTHQLRTDDSDTSEEKMDLSCVKVGLEGERDTTLMLREWMKDKPGVVLLDSLHIKSDYKDADTEDVSEETDEETGLVDGKDTDHALVIGDIVVLIDTKRWKSKRRYSLSDSGEVLRMEKPFPGGNVKMKNAIFLWRDYLIGGTKLNGIVFINSEETHVVRNARFYSQNFRLIEQRRFIEFLDYIWNTIAEERDRTIINSSLVAQIAVCCIKPYDPMAEFMNVSGMRKLDQI